MTPVRCSCKGTLPSSCNCTLSDTSTIDVSGAGSSASPFTLAPDLAADPGLLTCEADGFLGKWPDEVLKNPCAKVFRNDAETLTGMPTQTAFEFDTEIYDTGGFWAAGTPTRLTNNMGFRALFAIGCSISIRQPLLATNETRTLSVRLNGTTNAGGKTRAVVDGKYSPEVAPVSFVALNDNLTFYTELPLDAGQYVECLVGSLGSGDLVINSYPRLSPIFWITFITDVDV